MKFKSHSIVFSSSSSHTKLPEDEHIRVSKEWGGDFEMNSVMMYSTSGGSHVTLNDENISGGDRVTTMDSLQINWMYCRNMASKITKFYIIFETFENSAAST